MIEELLKYWKSRWPLASQNEEVLIHSANYRETKAAFKAGYQAAEQTKKREVEKAFEAGYRAYREAFDHYDDSDESVENSLKWRMAEYMKDNAGGAGAKNEL